VSGNSRTEIEELSGGFSAEALMRPVVVIVHKVLEKFIL